MGVVSKFRERIVKTKVLENYAMMGSLKVADVVIGFVVYPFVIRAVGIEEYGHYVLALTIANLAQVLVSLGFDTPRTKRVVESGGNKDALSTIVSCVLTLRLLCWTACMLAVVGLLAVVSSLREIAPLIILSFVGLVNLVLFHSWYYQGIKKMRVVTAINVACRAASIPFVFWLVRSPEDITTYATISCMVLVVAGIVSHLWITRHDGLRVRLVSPRRVVPYLRESVPFFASCVTESVKDNMINIIINALFGAASLAVYDLANKILGIPRTLFNLINAALFPEMVGKATKSSVRSMLRYETLIGIGGVALMAIIGYPAVIILGGEAMTGAYPLLVVASLSIITYLIVGVYLNFVFVPAGRSILVSVNQLVALASSVLLILLSCLTWLSPLSIVSSLALSGFAEILFCWWVTRREGLMR